ncbi:MAG: DUF371 domain-containing protein [Palaeococcus sp.]|uniref:DUF371 domain-containing protein n=1 Tax=Palaeococcus sp. (in: euryarchaeotes) TaxID=2820298 RepID=UPI0025CE2F17|nr:DUF371 domain-containing protein [Palaeococcus sp. (in: euryarchaeotes)]MCD6558982.1 DUF371 domain-containing protein [Palaeococcus sp. (in: euryarchaeotes)]
MIRERIVCWGHENVRATHKSTLEFTKEDFLTPRGDCILCIKANKGINDLSEEFKKGLKSGKKLTIKIMVDEIEDELIAWGDERLILDHATSMVVRKSEYIDSRTLAVRADKAARDIKREIVEKLKNPEQKAVIELIIDD